jgi:hypothetical protein
VVNVVCVTVWTHKSESKPTQSTTLDKFFVPARVVQSFKPPRSTKQNNDNNNSSSTTTTTTTTATTKTLPTLVKKRVRTVVRSRFFSRATPASVVCVDDSQPTTNDNDNDNDDSDDECVDDCDLSETTLAMRNNDKVCFTCDACCCVD